MNKISIVLILAIFLITPLASKALQLGENIKKITPKMINSEKSVEISNETDNGGQFTKTRHRGIELMSSSTNGYSGVQSQNSQVPITLVNDTYQNLYWYESVNGQIIGVFSNLTMLVYNSMGKPIFKYKFSKKVGSGCVFDDFTGDGDTDFALVDFDTSSKSVDIIIFDIDNAQQYTTTPILLNYSFTSVNITGVDLDGDGYKELALIAPPQIAFYDISNGVPLYINSTLVSYRIKNYFTSDIDGDGLESLILHEVNNSEHIIEELRFNGTDLIKDNDKFTPPSSTKPVFVSYGDFDGDGDDDILLTFLINNTHLNATILSKINQIYYSNIVKVTSSPNIATITDVFSYDVYLDSIEEPFYLYWIFPSSTYYIAFLNTSSSSLVNVIDEAYYLSYALIDRNLDSVPEIAIQENNTKGNWIEVYDSNMTLTENFTVPFIDLTLVGGAEIDSFYGKFAYEYSGGYCILRDRESSAKLDLIKPDTTYLQVTKNGSVYVSWQTYISWRATNITVNINGTVVWWSQSEFNKTIKVNFTAESIYNVSVNLYVIDIGVLTVFFYIDYDITPPKINSVKPTNNTYTRNLTITVFWNVTDNVKLRNVSIFLNNTLKLVSSNSTGLFNISISSEGYWNLTVLAIDYASNDNITVTIFVVDRTPPDISITNPKNDSYSNKNVVINYLALDKFGVSRIEVYDNNTYIKEVNPSSTSITLTNLVDGLHKITLVAYDKAENSNLTQININIDSKPPIISSSLTNYSKVPSPFNFSFSVIEDNLDIVKIYLNGTLVGTYDAKNITNEIMINYPDGGWANVTVFASDLAGNSNTLTLLLSVDVELPIINIIAPVNWTITNNSSIEIKWNSNYTDIVSVEVYLNGSFINNASYSTKSFILNIENGTNEITLVAFDDAGNIYSVRVYVVLDVYSPKITKLVYPSFINSTRVFIEINAADNIGVKEIRVIYGTKVLVVLDETIASQINLDEGNNTVEIIVLDLAGNENKTLIWVFVDLNKPDLLIYEPKNYTYTMNSTLKISLKYDDLESGIQEAKVLINGTLIYKGVYKTILISLDKDGVYMIKIVVLDRAGNINVKSLVIYRDTTPPILSKISPKNGSLVPVSQYMYISISDKSPTLMNISLNGELVITQFEEKNINVSLSFKEGINVIQVTVMDFAGNKITIVVYYTSDQKPPELSIYPTSGEFLVGEEIYFQVNVSDDYGVLRVDVYVDGDYIGSLIEEKSEFKLTFGDLGTHRITFVGIDIVGNKVSQVIIINIIENKQNSVGTSLNTFISLLLIVSAIVGLTYGYFKRS